MKTVILFLLLLALSQLVNVSHGATPLKSEVNLYKPYLIKWEGYKNREYICSTGNHCVGIGHLLTSKERNWISAYYSDAQIDKFFLSDLESALKSCRANISRFDSLPQDAKLVAVSVSFNVGEGKFIKFAKFRLALSKRNYQDAASELRDSKWAKQVQKSRREDHVGKLNNLK